MTLSGSQKLAILLCKFSDTANDEPHDKAYFEDWLATAPQAGSTTTGPIPRWERSTWTARPCSTGRPSTRKGKLHRRPAYAVGQDSWRHRGVRAEPGGIRRVVTIFNADVGDAGAQNGVLVGPNDVNVTFLAHETGHVFGLRHSFDQSDRKDADWSAPGKYFDGYDIMSAMNVSSHTDPRFNQSGPLLCTATRDLMGWLPGLRVWTPPDHQSSVTDFDLVSLGHPEVPGYLAARVGGYYVEIRTDDGWDSGISRPCVLIHAPSGPNAVVIAQDKANYVNEWQPGQTLGPADLALAIAGGTSISILSFDVRGNKARIRVQHQVAKPIVAGPATDVFGGVGVDGGGKVIKVPPRSPVGAMLSRLAMVSQAEETLGNQARTAVTGAVFKEIEQLAKRARR